MRFLWLIGLLFSAAVVPAAAQEAEPLLLIRPYQGNFLLAYDGAEVRPVMEFAPTEGIYSGFPVVYAPDATRFAYLARVGDGNQTRIYVADLDAHGLIPVEGQDDDKIRSNPTWSPDGSQIAWNQVDDDGGHLQTVIYDFASNTAQVVYQREVASAAFLVTGVQWGEAGLALYDVVRLDDDQQQVWVTFIDPVGREIDTVILDEQPESVVGQWANLRDQAYFVLSADGNQLTVVNPQTHAVESLIGRLEHYSLSTPQSIGLTQIVSDNEWVVFGPNFNGGLGVNQSEYSVSISPDGQRLALVTFENYPFGGKVYVVDNFEGFPYAANPVTGMDSAGYGEEGALYVFWGPTGLRIQDN